MYKILDKFVNCSAHCDKFTVNLSEATQDQLEHLFHLGHKGVQFIGKKPKNKPVDNLLDVDNIGTTNE